MTSLHQLTVVIALILVLYSEAVETYTLVHNYDYTNWYSSFIFEDVGTGLDLSVARLMFSASRSNQRIRRLPVSQ